VKLADPAGSGGITILPQVSCINAGGNATLSVNVTFPIDRTGGLRCHGTGSIKRVPLNKVQIMLEERNDHNPTVINKKVNFHNLATQANVAKYIFTGIPVLTNQVLQHMSPGGNYYVKLNLGNGCTDIQGGNFVHVSC